MPPTRAGREDEKIGRDSEWIESGEIQARSEEREVVNKLRKRL